MGGGTDGTAAGCIRFNNGRVLYDSEHRWRGRYSDELIRGNKRVEGIVIVIVA